MPATSAGMTEQERRAFEVESALARPEAGEQNDRRARQRDFRRDFLHVGVAKQEPMRAPAPRAKRGDDLESMSFERVVVRLEAETEFLAGSSAKERQR